MIRSKLSLPAALSSLRHLGGASIVLSPLVTCIVAGSIHAPLWLDEISYWYYERNPSLRALEMRRPGSALAQFFMNYFYCDIQRAVHWIVRPLGLTIQSDPELYLRFLSILSFAAAGLVAYFVTFRESQSWRWSVAAALVTSASPLLLFYAFEARLAAFATLGVVVYLALLSTALRRPSNGLLIAGATGGIFLGHLHAWIVCLFAGLCVAAILRFFVSRQWREMGTVAAFALPGAVVATGEAAFITLTYPGGGYAFPLYNPRPLWLLQEGTFAGTFSAAMSAPPSFLKPFASGPSVPLLMLAVAVITVLLDLRRSPLVVIPASAVLSLWISIAVGSYFGHLIVPRYQVPLFGALFFSLAFAATQRVRLCVVFLGVLQFLQLPTAITDVAAKGNGKEIAALIESEARREKTAIIVQHSLRLGYPDPLHNFVLHFYLNELRPTATPLRIHEIPSMRDITGEEGLRNYFGGGMPLLRSYAMTPRAQWRDWLETCPYERVWLVTPVPFIRLEANQIEAFRATLLESGFVEDRRRGYHFSGYPHTYVGLFVRTRRREAADQPRRLFSAPLDRSNRHDSPLVKHFTLQRVPDLRSIDEGRHKNGLRPADQR